MDAESRVLGNQGIRVQENRRTGYQRKGKTEDGGQMKGEGGWTMDEKMLDAGYWMLVIGAETNQRGEIVESWRVIWEISVESCPDNSMIKE